MLGPLVCRASARACIEAAAVAAMLRAAAASMLAVSAFVYGARRCVYPHSQEVTACVGGVVAARGASGSPLVMDTQVRMRNIY